MFTNAGRRHHLSVEHVGMKCELEKGKVIHWRRDEARVNGENLLEIILTLYRRGRPRVLGKLQAIWANSYCLSTTYALKISCSRTEGSCPHSWMN